MIIGISGCTALIIAGLGMNNSVKGIMEQQYTQIMKYDMSVTFSDEITPEILEEFEKISDQFNEEGHEDILKEWRKRSYTIGKIVEVREPFNTYYDGYVIGIGKEGALVVEKIDGTLEKVISGECIIKN